VVLESSINQAWDALTAWLGLTEESKATDFGLGLSALSVIRMTNLSQLGHLRD